MSVDLSNSVIKVFRDENDKYYTFLTGNIFNMINGQTEGRFYSKRKIKFPDGNEVKNKAKIKVLDGFASPYKMRIKDGENGTKIISGELYYIKSFELIEDGIDEKQKPFVYNPRQPKATPQEQPQAKKVKLTKAEEKLNSFSFNDYSSVTPF